MLCGVSSVPPALAWENDVHYGLTWWLAKAVGFSDQQSTWIAKGDQGVDDSNVTGPVLSTAMSSCTATDPSGSATVAKNHFPSRALPPAPAASRVVSKGEPWWETRRAEPPRTDGSEPTLLSLGRYLHSLQDSWSHQGEPDIPLSCNPRLAWGHSPSRGGWSCHLADLAYKWVLPDVIPMAKATYEALVVAYGKEPRAIWAQLAPQVQAFGRIDNKQQKSEWLQAHGIANHKDIAYATSLQNCPTGTSSCSFDYALDQAVADWASRLQKLPLLEQSLKDVGALLNKFGDAMIEGSEAKLRELIDTELAQIALQRALNINGSCADFYKKAFEWSLLRPFSLSTGARQPIAVCELAMQISSEKPGTACSAATEAAIRAPARPRGIDLRLLLDKFPKLSERFRFSYLRRAVDNDRQAEFWADGYFPHLPKDRLLVGVKRVGDAYKISAFVWYPDE